jgi:hypothetical protein
MLKIKTKKVLAFALCSLMAASTFGTVVAEAHPHDFPPPRQEESASHSEGEVITAGIVGAVVGAVIAKNT